MSAHALTWSRLAELPLPPPRAPSAPKGPPLSPIAEESSHSVDIHDSGFYFFYGLLAFGLIVWIQLGRAHPPPDPSPVSSVELASL